MSNKGVYIAHMPKRPPHKCNKQGCKVLTTDTYCEKHKSIQQDYYYGRKYGSTWTKLRNMYIREHPICEECHMLTAKEVHHIVPVMQGGALLDVNNLKALCFYCHDKLEKNK